MMGTTVPLLQFRNVEMFRGGQKVLSNISWTVSRNDNWVIFGPMGSGKTTLLEVIAGKLPVRTGEAQFTPKDTPVDRWELSKYIALASFRNQLINGADFYYQQRYNWFSSEQVPTVGEYLGNNGVNHPDIKALQIEELLRLELVKLSNGQTRRVMLAKILLSHPALLLLDNPFAGLDTEARASFHELVEHLLSHGQKMILTCNYLQDIPKGITHLLYLNHNCIEYQGPLEEGIDFVKEAMKNNTRLIQDTFNGTINSPSDGSLEKVIELKNVTVQYDSKLVLDQVNWTVMRNEKWALMGKNGSGKSSLLSLLNADNPQAYRNDILLFDHKREYGRSIWQIKKRIGFFSPELHAWFNENLTVFDTLATGYTDTFVPKAMLTPDEVKRIHDLLTFYSMEHLLERRYQNLSSGEQRLMLFLRSLVKPVELLILDEPFQGFDQTLIEQSRRLIDLYVRHITLIFVTHYPDEVPSCVTKVLTLENGKVV